MADKNSFNISKLSQKEIRNLAVLTLKKISNPEGGIGADLFAAIISLAPQVTVEAVVVDNIENPTKVLVTPRNDRYYPKSCQLPGSFIRYSESFSKRLRRLVKNELKANVKEFKDTDIKYNRLEKKERRHFVGFYFLVELRNDPKVTYQWVDYIPKNLPSHHAHFLKSYFGWKKGKALWREGLKV